MFVSSLRHGLCATMIRVQLYIIVYSVFFMHLCFVVSPTLPRAIAPPGPTLFFSFSFSQSGRLRQRSYRVLLVHRGRGSRCVELHLRLGGGDQGRRQRATSAVVRAFFFSFLRTRVRARISESLLFLPFFFFLFFNCPQRQGWSFSTIWYCCTCDPPRISWPSITCTRVCFFVLFFCHAHVFGVRRVHPVVVFDCRQIFNTRGTAA